MRNEPTIDPSVVRGNNVTIGHYVVIEQDVRIGDNVTIGNFTIIKKGTQIGNDVLIEDGVVLGKLPFSNNKMARKASSENNPLIIKDRVKIGCNVVINCNVLIESDVLIGDLASIRENVQVGKSSIIGRNATIELNTTIGNRVVIQTSSYITGDMIIEDDVFIGPCCSSSNDKYMGEGNYKYAGPHICKGAKIGNNATLLPGIKIGEMAVVGAGSVITKDVPAHEVYIGNPCKKLEKRP